jgi:hypothetical protein
MLKFFVILGFVFALGLVAWAASVLNAEYKQQDEKELERRRDREYER